MKLEAFAAAEEASVREHVECFGMEGPVGALSGSVGATRNFHEAVVEAEVVTERVLPSLRVGSVIWKSVGDVSVNGEVN